MANAKRRRPRRVPSIQVAVDMLAGNLAAISPCAHNVRRLRELMLLAAVASTARSEFEVMTRVEREEWNVHQERCTTCRSVGIVLDLLGALWQEEMLCPETCTPEKRRAAAAKAARRIGTRK